MKRDCIVGIDIGGTSIKVMVCDSGAEQICFEKSATLPAYKTQDGSTDTGPQRRFDGEILWQITLNTLTKAIAALPQDCQVRSLAVSSCGCTVLLLDQEGRQIDMNMKACPEKLQEEVIAYRQHFTPEEFFAHTGYPLEGDNSGFHLSAFCTQRGSKDIAHVLSVDDYITWRLCGKPVRNFSTAVSCGMWDWEKGNWLSFFLERTGLNEEILGRPLESGVQVGHLCTEVARETGLPEDTAVCTGGHDYECAAFACHPFVKDNIFSITGTIDLMASFSKADSPVPIAGCRHISDRHVLPGYRSAMMETIGAVQTEWLKNHICARKEYGASLSWDVYFEEMADTYEKNFCTTELFLPKVFGTYLPQVNHQAFGAYLGLNKQTDSAKLLRAMVEGMAFQNRRMVDWLKGDDESPKKMVLVGGASKNLIWVQMKADILNMDILSVAISEASALGAALLGGVGCGIYDGYEQACNTIAQQTPLVIHPNPRRAMYYKELFTDLYLPLEEIIEKFDKKHVQLNQTYLKG